MKLFLHLGSIALIIISSAYGFQDVDTFQARINSLNVFKNQEAIHLKEEINNKINEIESLKNPNFLSYDQKIQTKTTEGIKKEADIIKSESESISLSHIENELQKLLKIKEQQQSYFDAKNKTQELKNKTSNSKNLQKYMELMSAPTTGLQDAIIEGRYLVLNKEEKEIADEFKKNLFIVSRESGIQQSLEKEIKAQALKIEEALSFEENKIRKVKESQSLIENELKSFNIHKENVSQSHQFSWNINTLLSQDKLGGFSCDPKITPKYYRFKNYPNLIAFSNGKDYNSIISLDKENPQKFNQVYTCIQGEYGCYDQKAPALCNLDPECKAQLESAVSAYKVDGYEVFKNKLLSEAMAKNEADQFRDGNLISELQKVNRLSDSDVKKLKEMHQKISLDLQSLKNTNPEEFHKEVKKKIDGMVELEKKSPKLSKNMQIGYIFMLQGMKSKVGELKGEYFLEMNSFKFCPGESDSTNTYCDQFSAYLKTVSKFDDVQEIENLSASECPVVSFRIPKNELPLQEECTVKPIVSGMEEMIKIQEELKKTYK
jgi:hypothetical protein